MGRVRDKLDARQRQWTEHPEIRVAEQRPVGITFAYIRCSTLKQDVIDQKAIARGAGVADKHMLIDIGVSGKNLQRPALLKLDLMLRPGDTVFLTKLSRAGRNQRETIDWLAGEQTPPGLIQRGVDFIIADAPFLSSGYNAMPAGLKRGLLEIFAWLAEEERDLLIRSVKDSMHRRMLLGMKPGQKPIDPEIVKQIRHLHYSEGWNYTRIAKLVAPSRATVKRYCQDLTYAPTPPMRTPGTEISPAPQRTEKQREASRKNGMRQVVRHVLKINKNGHTKLSPPIGPSGLEIDAEVAF